MSICCNSLENRICAAGLKMRSTFILLGPRCEKLDFVTCKKQRRRPACAFAQSGQRLYFSLTAKCTILTRFIQNCIILASPCSGQTGLSFTMSQIPKARFLATWFISNIDETIRKQWFILSFCHVLEIFTSLCINLITNSKLWDPYLLYHLRQRKFLLT